MNDVFSVRLVHKTDATTIVTGTVVSLSNGVYQMTYTLVKAGTYTMTITVQPGGSGPTYQIKDSPLQVQCNVNLVDTTKTTLTGVGVTQSTAGVVTTFKVTLFDSGNNQRETGGDTLLVTIGAITDIETFDHDDGTYTVQYKILDAS
jgi:hypothetical protein